MRVLWVLGEVPIPADSGARLRILGLLKPLAAQHEVTTAVLDPGPAGQTSLRELERICDRVAVLPWRGRLRGARVAAGAALNLLSPYPYSVARYCTLATERRLSELVGMPFDVIQSENIGFHRYLCAPASGPRILATHNVEADVWRQRSRLSRGPLLSAYLTHQAIKMARYESWLVKRYDYATAVTEGDAARLRSEYGCADVAVVPNGVDTDYFRPTGESPEPGLVVFTGAMDYEPNDDAVRYFLTRVWPALLQRHPRARFLVVGRRPASSLRELAASLPSVEVTGQVPDVRPYLARASVIAVPLRIGGGSRLKILEAMAMAKPVISTSIGAEGLCLDPARHIRIADTPTAFIEETCRLLDGDEAGAALGQTGRLYAEEHCGWAGCAERLARTWAVAAGCRKGTDSVS
jgi:sugar transferase (PEP-CTERM/EpsH1 system associated)